MPSGTSDPAFMAYNRNSFQIPAPEISAHPVSRAVCPGGTATFTVSVTATGTELDYQWEKNGIRLNDGNGVSGSNTATLVITPVTANDNAVYRCLVTNPAGSAFSNPAYLNSVVLSATGSSTCQGTSSFVEVGAQGNSPQYQWYKNTTASNTGGTIINGATSSTYTPSAASAVTEYYYAEVYPAGYECAMVTSDAVPFTVSYASAGTVSGTTTVCAGNSATVSISNSTGNIQWQQSTDNGATWAAVTTGSGGTTSSYTTAALTATTQFRAVVTSGTCTSTSGVATVTVNDTNVWTGATDIYWNTASNWSCGTVPTQYTIVSIPAEPVNQPTVIGLTGHAKSLTVSNGAHVTVATAGSLQIVNEINVVTGGSLVVNNNGSLIQDNANAVNAGTVTVHKESNSLFRLDYTLWSSPVSGQQLLAFSPQTYTTRFYEYAYGVGSGSATSSEQFFIVDPSTTNFESAKGYLIRMPNGDSTPGYNAGTASMRYKGIFTGSLHNGTVTRPLSVQGPRYTAVGNPYASPISVADFFTQNEAVLQNGSALYFWRKKNDHLVSSYATLTLAAFTANSATPAATGVPNQDYVYGGQDQAVYYSGNNVNWRIAQGQGFFVKAAESLSSPVVTFTNTMRREAPSTGNQGFFRTAEATASRLWLNLAGSQDAFSQMAVAYIDGATTGLDYGYDGVSMNNSGIVSLYSLAANENLTIQARPLFNDQDVVAVGYAATNAGTYTISIDHTDGVFEEGQEIYLRDNLLNTTVSLENAYSFTTQPGTFDDRFEVVYVNAALDTDAPELSANSVVVYKDNNVININSGNADMTDVTLFDINGRQLYSKSGINAVQTTIAGLQVQQQVLLVEINTVKGKVTKKIVF